MPRQIRDTVLTLAALCVLFTMLISISPRLRERAGEFGGGGVNGQGWDPTQGAFGHVMETVLAAATGFAADNTYMFAFLIVAGVLFVLMLRT